MKLSNLKIGILHSLIGQNDGVSIVIDQSVEAMVDHMGINMQNIFYLTGHSASHYNTMVDDIFWHKNEENKYILKYYNEAPPRDLDDFILENAQKAKKIIKKWVNKYDLDAIIAHNSCHPSNFIYAVGLSMYFEEIRKQRRIRPRYVLWWHDSHYERERFQSPNEIITKYQSCIPGPYVDGIIFINSQQEKFARQYYKEIRGDENIDFFFDKKAALIPNTCHIEKDWDLLKGDDEFYPDIDQFNKSFLKDAGILRLLKREGYGLEDTVFFLQHTRIVRRKRIDLAIDFVFDMAKKYKKEKQNKVLILIVSGHGRDEHDEYHRFLKKYFTEKQEKNSSKNDLKVFLIFAENIVLPHREIVVEKKFYKFGDIPGIVAHYGGMGTYFSEVEGYGNNLLEMLSAGLPVVINEYPIYKTDIKLLGFDLPYCEQGGISSELINECYELLNDKEKRLDVIKLNLQILREELSHRIICDRLTKFMKNVFTYT